jgi:hypothetical protein
LVIKFKENSNLTLISNCFIKNWGNKIIAMFEILRGAYAEGGPTVKLPHSPCWRNEWIKRCLTFEHSTMKTKYRFRKRYHSQLKYMEFFYFFRNQHGNNDKFRVKCWTAKRKHRTLEYKKSMAWMLCWKFDRENLKGWK